MSAWTFLISLTWALVAGACLWRAEPVLRAWIAAWQAVHVPVLNTPVPVPDDLVALAATHSEDWAREETLAKMRELYEELGDWALVRPRFGVGGLP